MKSNLANPKFFTPIEMKRRYPVEKALKATAAALFAAALALLSACAHVIPQEPVAKEPKPAPAEPKQPAEKVPGQVVGHVVGHVSNVPGSGP